MHFDLAAGKKLYFASDLHLGLASTNSLDRERRFVQWLQHIEADCQALFLVGDVFDFWFEYRKSVPKGFTRILGQLAQMSDRGIDIHFFIGNHDLWTFGYLRDELGIKVHYKPLEFSCGGQQFYVAHGDGLGPGDYTYKVLRKVFHSGLCQWLFKLVHPDLGIGLAHLWSHKSRFSQGEVPGFFGADKEWLVLHAAEVLQQRKIDHFLFGHRHIAHQHVFEQGSVCTHLGEWINRQDYAVFDGSTLRLDSFVDV